MPNRKLIYVLILTVIFSPLAFAHAQTQRLPGVIDKPTPKEDIPPYYLLDNALAPPLGKKPEIKKIKNANKVLATLKSVTFKGNTVISNKNLQLIVAPYINKELTKGGLAQLKYDVKKAFYDKGYILVHVITPPQKFTKGDLKINIYEAKISQINIKNDNIIKPWLTKTLTGRTKPGQVIKENALESMITDLSNLENVRASVNLRPGKRISTTDLDILISQAKEEQHFISVDNYGSRLTGDIVTSLHSEYSNLLKMGEKFNIDIQRSKTELWNAAIGAIIPIAIKNLKLETNFFHSENDIDGRLEDLKARGETQLLNIALSSKLLNTRKRQNSLRFGYEYRTHESLLAGVADTKDNIRKFFLENSYIYRGISSLLYISTKVSKGIRAFGASQKGEPSATRSLGKQDSWIIEPTILFNTRPFSKNGTIKTLIRGQIASHKLLSSDLFTIGGYGSIRGFNVAQEAAEEGYSLTLEYNHILPIQSEKIKLKAGPFLDAGALYNRVSGNIEDNHFYSVGLGLEAKAKLIPTDETILRMDWGHPVGSYRSNNISNDTFYFSLKQNF